MGRNARLTAPVYVHTVRALAVTFLALTCLYLLASGAEGRSARNEGLRFHQVGLDGHHRRVLSIHATSFGFYELSPDRKQLAFVEPYDLRSDPARPALDRRPGPSGSRILLDAKTVGHGSGSIFALAWAPNGKSIAVSISYGSREPDDGIWLINSDGTGLRQVAAMHDIPRTLRGHRTPHNLPSIAIGRMSPRSFPSTPALFARSETGTGLGGPPMVARSSSRKRVAWRFCP